MTHTLSRRARHMRRFRRGALAMIAISLIGFAALVGGLALALPWLTSHPERVREFLSEKIGRPVQFAQVTAHWRPSGPVFALDGLELDDPAGKAEPFRIAHAELVLDFYAWAHRYGSFTELRLSGLSLEATRNVDGGIELAQFGDSSGDSHALLDLGSVSLQGARLTIRDVGHDATLHFPRADLRLVNTMDGRHFGARLWTEGDATPLRISCRSQAEFGSGRCYLGGTGLGLGAWLGEMPQLGLTALSGTLDLGVWLNWNEGLDSVEVEAHGHDWVLSGKEPVPIGQGDVIEARSHFESPTLAAAWRRAGGGWRLDLASWRNEAREAPRTSLAVLAEGPEDDRHYALAAPRVALEDWLPYAALSRPLPIVLRGWLFAADPRGELRHVRANWDARDSDVRAELIGLQFAATRYGPGLESLSASLAADNNALIISADANPHLRLDFAHVFRQPLELDLKSLTLAALRTEDGARFEATDLAVGAAGFSASGRAAWEQHNDGSAPFLDLSLALGRSSIPAAKQFWPVNAMPRSTVAWLDRALVAGTIESGSVIFRGPAANFPFRNHEGRFEARARLVNAEIDYHPDWPRARFSSAELVFADSSMNVAIDSGTVQGIAIANSNTRIADLSHAVVDVDVKGGSSGEHLLEFIRTTPIKTRGGTFLDGLKLGGEGELALNLKIPLGDEPGEATVVGQVQLNDSDIHAPKLGLEFQKATGPIRFSGHGFAADALALRYGEADASLALAVGEFVRDPKHQVEARLSGRLTPAEVFANVGAAKSLLDHMSGRSQWDLALAVDGDSAPHPGASHLALRSDLVGTALSFPAPLAKSSEVALPAEIDTDWPIESAPLKVKLGDLVRLDAVLAGPQKQLAGAMAFGRGEMPQRPAAGLVVAGDVGALDLDGWGSFGSGDSAGIALAELKVAQLRALGHDFGASAVKLSSAKEATVYSFSGANLEGNVEWPTKDLARRGISARFERLLVPSSPPPAGTDAKADAKPVAKSDSLDPSRLPPLHVWCKSLKLGGVNFGEARLESYPRDNVLYVDKFESRSDTMTLNAHGDWLSDATGEHSKFELNLSADDLGKLLDAFGYTGVVAGGATGVEFNGQWPGSPAAFSLARASGKLSAKVGQGRILEVDPGAGRLFGLISLNAIPRRLSLDFSDLFKSGFSIDSMEGTFELAAGNATTQDLEVKSPAAEINIKGRTGIAARDYDQEMIVLPRTSVVLPVVGALTAGPVGAAAGALVQNFLSKPLKNAARARYHVTGSWDKPEITLIERNEARAAAPQGDNGNDNRTRSVARRAP